MLFLIWCADQSLDPLRTGRADIERYVRCLLGLRIFEACGANIDNLGEEHGHRGLKVRGEGDKTALIPLPPAVSRAIDRAVDSRDRGPILRNIHGVRMDRHAATRRLNYWPSGGDPDRVWHVTTQHAELPMRMY